MAHRGIVLGLAALAATAAVSSAPAASAYVFYLVPDCATGSSTDDCVRPPLRWFRRALTFHLSTVLPEELPWGDLRGLAEAAFAQWSGTACGLVPSPRYGGTEDDAHGAMPTTIDATGDNLIVFIRTTAEWTQRHNQPSWIAITKIAHNLDTGEIIDADIEINDGGFTFSTDGTPAPDEVDFLAMLTHETGHYFGLDHSLDPTATMYATYSHTPATALEARTLAPDDIDGICALYTDVPRSPFEASGHDDDCAGGGPSAMGAALLACIQRVLHLRRARARRPG